MPKIVAHAVSVRNERNEKGERRKQPQTTTSGGAGLTAERSFASMSRLTIDLCELLRRSNLVI